MAGNLSPPVHAMSMRSSLYHHVKSGFHIYEDQATGTLVVETPDQRIALSPELWAVVILTLQQKAGL